MPLQSLHWLCHVWMSVLACAQSVGHPKMLRILFVLGLAAFCAAKKDTHCCSAEDRHVVQKQWQTLFDYMEHSSKLKIEFGEILLLRYRTRCQERLQNHRVEFRVEFRVTRISTRWKDSGLGLGLGENFIKLIYQLIYLWKWALIYANYQPVNLSEKKSSSRNSSNSKVDSTKFETHVKTVSA